MKNGDECEKIVGMEVVNGILNGNRGGCDLKDASVNDGCWWN